MALTKSPYFEVDTYSQQVTCEYCGYSNSFKEKDIQCAYWDTNTKLSWFSWCEACGKYVAVPEKIYTLVQERLFQRKDCFRFFINAPILT